MPSGSRQHSWPFERDAMNKSYVVFKVRHDEVMDLIMAADGLAAALDRGDPDRVRVIGDDLARAVSRFIPQAAEWFAYMSAGTHVEHDDDDTTLVFRTLNAFMPLRRQLVVAAMAWHILSLVLMGVDGHRAQACADRAAHALGVVNRAPQDALPPRCTPHWF